MTTEDHTANARISTMHLMDGTLSVMTWEVPGFGVRATVTHRGLDGTHDRLPTLAEIAEVRADLLPTDREFALGLDEGDAHFVHLAEVAPEGVVSLQGRRFKLALCLNAADQVVTHQESGLPLAVLAPWTPDPWLELSEDGGTVDSDTPTTGGTDADTHPDHPQDGR